MSNVEYYHIMNKSFEKICAYIYSQWERSCWCSVLKNYEKDSRKQIQKANTFDLISLWGSAAEFCTPAQFLLLTINPAHRIEHDGSGWGWISQLRVPRIAAVWYIYIYIFFSPPSAVCSAPSMTSSAAWRSARARWGGCSWPSGRRSETWRDSAASCPATRRPSRCDHYTRVVQTYQTG